jgi:hypothetical protein
MRISGWLSLAAILAASSATCADLEDRPHAGMAFNTTERSALTYRCTQVDEDHIHCVFNQMAVRRKLLASEVNAKLAEFDKSLASEKPMPAKDCAEMRQLAGDSEALLKKNGKLKDPRDRAIAKEELDALVEHCDTGSFEPIRRITKRDLERQVRACRVSSNDFEQTFKRGSKAGENPVWIVESTPEGPCGLIQLSRFERVRPFGLRSFSLTPS